MLGPKKKSAPGADPTAVANLLAELNARVGAVPDVRVSVAAENTMGLEWFPDGWTHVWEQAFDDEAAMRRVAEHDAALLAASPMAEWVDVWYEIEREPTNGVPVSDARAFARPDQGSVHLVETVVVAPEDTDAYQERKIVGVGVDKSRRCENVYKGTFVRPGKTLKKRVDV